MVIALTVGASASCGFLDDRSNDSFRFDERAQTQEEKNLENGAKWKALNFPEGWTISNARLVKFSVANTDIAAADRSIQVFRPDGQMLLSGKVSELTSGGGIALLVPHRYGELVVKEGTGAAQTESTVGIDRLNQAIHNAR